MFLTTFTKRKSLIRGDFWSTLTNSCWLKSPKGMVLNKYHQFVILLRNHSTTISLAVIFIVINSFKSLLKLILSINSSIWDFISFYCYEYLYRTVLKRFNADASSIAVLNPPFPLSVALTSYFHMTVSFLYFPVHHTTNVINSNNPCHVAL